MYILYIYIGKSGTKFKVGQWVSQECMQRLVWSISKSCMLYYAILAGWYFHPPFFSAYKSWMMIPLDFEICDEWLNHQTRHSIYICVCVYVSITRCSKLFPEGDAWVRKRQRQPVHGSLYFPVPWTRRLESVCEWNLARTRHHWIS